MNSPPGALRPMHLGSVIIGVVPSIPSFNRLGARHLLSSRLPRTLSALTPEPASGGMREPFGASFVMGGRYGQSCDASRFHVAHDRGRARQGLVEPGVRRGSS